MKMTWTMSAHTTIYIQHQEDVFPCKNKVELDYISYSVFKIQHLECIEE